MILCGIMMCSYFHEIPMFDNPSSYIEYGTTNTSFLPTISVSQANTGKCYEQCVVCVNFFNNN